MPGDAGRRSGRVRQHSQKPAPVPDRQTSGGPAERPNAPTSPAADPPFRSGSPATQRSWRGRGGDGAGQDFMGGGGGSLEKNSPTPHFGCRKKRKKNPQPCL